MLLNFINATFGASNEAAMGKMNVQRTQVRAHYNLDCWLVLSALGYDKPFDSVIVKYPELPMQDGRWHGYTQTITRALSNQTEGILASIKNYTTANEQIENLKERIM